MVDGTLAGYALNHQIYYSSWGWRSALSLGAVPRPGGHDEAGLGSRSAGTEPAQGTRGLGMGTPLPLHTHSGREASSQLPAVR